MSEAIEDAVAQELATLDFEGNTTREIAQLFIHGLEQAGFIILPAPRREKWLDL